VAIAAKYHNIPFHCVSPLSTLDPNCKSGSDIEIENRNPKEVPLSSLPLIVLHENRLLLLLVIPGSIIYFFI
jgi:methylthioribose-1-phosphate isomerase